METVENSGMLIARLLMSVLFIIGGGTKFISASTTQVYFARYGLPFPELAWAIAVVVESGGGLAILFGLFTRPVAVVLAAWCVATALIAHTNFADRNMQIQFMKNLAMAGGFLYVALLGAGAWSLDAAPVRKHRMPATR